VKARFDDVLALAPESRRERLASLVDEEPDVRREVEGLLAAHDTLGGFLERPLDVDPGDLVDILGLEWPTMPAGESLPPGTRVGDYEIRREIGRGGMGIVYLAHDVHLSRPAALKSLPSAAGLDGILLQRFRREAQAAAAVSHPGVAMVYALVETPHGHFIASEFIAGRTLRQELARGPIEPARALRIAIDMLRALGAAHDAEVIHRDLKPENVLLTTGGAVKVIDFGIARIGHSDGPALTAPGTLQGTPGYMAPEQMVSSASTDSRADIYAAGVILAEMLLGVHPMAVERGAQVIPPLVASIVRRCLESDRERRYASTRDVLHDLEHAAQSLNDVAPPAPTAAGERSSGQARWWWEFHQAASALVYWAMLAPAWYARQIAGGRFGSVLFFVTLTALLLASILRLHLWFIARTSPREFAAEHRHQQAWIRGADMVFAVALLVSGLLVGESRMPLAVLLIAVAVGSAVIARFVEPSTTRAAFPDVPREPSAGRR